MHEFREDIDFKHSEVFLLGSTSMRDWGGSATLGCRSLNKVHLTTFDNHLKRSLVP